MRVKSICYEAKMEMQYKQMWGGELTAVATAGRPVALAAKLSTWQSVSKLSKARAFCWVITKHFQGKKSQTRVRSFPVVEFSTPLHPQLVSAFRKNWTINVFFLVYLIIKGVTVIFIVHFRRIHINEAI